MRPTIWGPDLRYQAFRVKSSVLNRRTTISDPTYDIKPLVLEFQNEALTYDTKPLDGKYETADLPYQAPTYDIKPFEFNRQYEIADQLYRTSTYDIKPLVLDVRNEALAYDIRPIGEKY